jgi:alpha-tubulin suppressor-like RCC1 family protein
MSGQRSADSEGTAESVAAGCNLRELPRIKKELRPDLDGPLAVFTWGRGEDGQLGLGDTSDQDQPTYGTYRYMFTFLGYSLVTNGS